MTENEWKTIRYILNNSVSIRKIYDDNSNEYHDEQILDFQGINKFLRDSHDLLVDDKK